MPANGKDGVLVQDCTRGKVCVCQVWSPVVVGRDPDKSGFHLKKDKQVEGTHCQLTAEFDGTIKVQDLSSSGVWLNEQRIHGQAIAKTDDLLRLGPTQQLRVLGLLDSKAPRRVKGMLSLPQRIDEFIFLRVVGHGAAGVVYEAYNEEERRRCAVKLLIAGGRAIPELIARFKREAELQSKLREYPGIVSVYDYGTLPDSGELYCVMEFVTGDTLRTRLRAGLTRLEGARLLARVARAVNYAHEHGLIHRDLKPSNVMVSATGVVRLTDFGLCKALEDEDSLTATGIMLGTPSYMAPEQIDDAKRVGRPADIYALGAMLYVILTGRLPHAADNLTEVLEKVAAGDLTPPMVVDPNVAPEMSALCMRAMAKDPARRPATAMELARELEAWSKQVDPPKKVTLRMPPKTGKQTKKKRRRSRERKREP